MFRGSFLKAQTTNHTNHTKQHEKDTHLNRRTTRTNNATTQTAKSPNRIYAAVETEIPIPVPMAMYAAMHSGHFGSKTRITPGVAHATTSLPPIEHPHLETAIFLVSWIFVCFVCFVVPVSKELGPLTSDNISHLYFRPRRTRRGNSTTHTAGPADNLRASPPTAPVARARSCRGSSRSSPAPRRRASR